MNMLNISKPFRLISLKRTTNVIKVQAETNFVQTISDEWRGNFNYYYLLIFAIQFSDGSEITHFPFK